MTSIDPVHLTERFHAAINALDFETIEHFFAEDATYSSDKVGGLAGRVEIMAAFRKYFAEYPDQSASDTDLQAVSPVACRSVWQLTATSATTGETMVRRGEETVSFNAQGQVVNVHVTDY